MSKVDRIQNNLEFSDPSEKDKFSLFCGILRNNHFEKIVGERFTLCFIVKLFHAFRLGENINEIVGEIGFLESSNNLGSSTKPPSQFKKNPLQGLWHKHYEPSNIGSMALNIQNQISKNKDFDAEIFEIINNEALSVNDKIQKMAYFSATQQYLDRKNTHSITGEWIIYHKHNNENYYLDIAKHSDGDEVLASYIKHAVQEFPSFKNDLPIFQE
ncbi:hypothetical protein I2F17_08995 [Acinetobacter sp. B10A]|uniref:hypothetical protein n=1 Tax=Acinetobacter baretiae TaxID=2605383 RepID=UPI001B3C4F9B|nr:hypothetical protein [Acinetobacter baretiae]MBF7685951.1 hypothetical protein [Acinetobacter baretiae]